MAVAVRDVVRYAVTEAAPHELPLLDSLWQLDDDAIGRVVTRSRRRRDPLAFGMNDAVQLVLPVVWVVLTETARQAASVAVTAGWRKLRVLRWFTRRGRAGSEGAPPTLLPPLSREQIADVRERVLAQSIAASLPRERAEALADAVAVRLTLAMDEEDSADTTAPEGGAQAERRAETQQATEAAEAEIGTEGEIEAGDAAVPGTDTESGTDSGTDSGGAATPIPEPRTRRAAEAGAEAGSGADDEASAREP